MNTSFAGKTAIVTGCSRGIGLAIAERMAEDGAHLVITARNAAKLSEAADHLRQIGAASVRDIAADVTDPRLPALLRDAANGTGGADILVNNAGVYPATSLADLTPERVGEVMGCNFDGVVALCREFVPAMANKGAGTVVNISSIGARVPIPGMALYAASKAALEAFSRSIAAEFAPTVRINCVSPGPILTEAAVAMSEGEDQAVTDTVTQGIPMQRRGTPEEVAEAVCFLASDRAGWTTGEVLQVNGGGYMG